MKRRNFIKGSAALMPFLLGRFPVSVFGSNSVWNSLLAASVPTNKKLILIHLEGGNDGLNTVIPLNRYSELMRARKNIMIPENKVLRLNNVSDTGLHPSFKGIQELYNNNMAMIIQGVGYPDQDYSHFKSSDIWMSGSNATFRETGWIGRLLEKKYHGYPDGYPNDTAPHPLAIRLGNASSKTTMGLTQDLGISISSDTIAGRISAPESGSGVMTDTMMGMATDMQMPSGSLAGMAVHSIQEINRLTEVYSPVLKKASDAQPNLCTRYSYEGDNVLADQLKIVARLIGGGLQTKLYILKQSGYDHHSQQVDSADSTVGSHAKLLKRLSDAVSLFQEDITLMGKQDEVMGVTFSEFGRRIISNGSFGTDHGSSEPLILFGSQLKNGFIGHNPEIPKQAGHDDNLLLQYDFRAVYSSILKDWFRMPADEVSAVFPGQLPHIDLFRS